MFARCIADTVFTSETANKLFYDRNIIVEPYMDDISYRSTMRALLLRRKETRNIAIKIHHVCQPSSFLEDGAPGAWGLSADWLNKSGGDTDDSRLLIVNIDADEGAAIEFFNKFSEKKDDLLPGFRKVEDLCVFYENHNVDARFFINEEKKRTAIFVRNLHTRTYHFLQSSTSRYFPWIFKESPLTEDEKSLLFSLASKNPQDYISALAKIAGCKEFRTTVIKEQLNGFEERLHKNQLDAVANEIKRVRVGIENLEAQFAGLYKRMEDLTTKELGLREKIRLQANDSGVMDFFLDSKSLNIVDVTESLIEFVVTTTLGNYDPESFLCSIENKESWVFYSYQLNKYRDEYSSEDIELLARALFEEEVIHLRVCAAFSLDFLTGEHNCYRGYSYGPEYVDYVPNQHIDLYSCLGDNERLIRESMTRRNYIGAFTACIASAASINMNEGITASHFMDRILDDGGGKVIDLPDGRNVTTKEAIAWLKARKEKKG